MKNGEYRNRAGAVLHVTSYFLGHGRVKSLGGIYEAEARDPLFGTTTYLVTEDSMEEAGYQLARESTEP